MIGGVNFKPNVSWSHDVAGYGPNGLFNEGAKAISVGVDADYRNTYTASLSYTDFFWRRLQRSRRPRLPRVELRRELLIWLTRKTQCAR
nr:hypothetical protein GCM10020185_48380 [Pseudomonas brassicacearum subsp. brassicacearum]